MIVGMAIYSGLSLVDFAKVSRTLSYTNDLKQLVLTLLEFTANNNVFQGSGGSFCPLVETMGL